MNEQYMEKCTCCGNLIYYSEEQRLVKCLSCGNTMKIVDFLNEQHRIEEQIAEGKAAKAALQEAEQQKQKAQEALSETIQKLDDIQNGQGFLTDLMKNISAKQDTDEKKLAAINETAEILLENQNDLGKLISSLNEKISGSDQERKLIFDGLYDWVNNAHAEETEQLEAIISDNQKVLDELKNVNIRIDQISSGIADVSENIRQLKDSDRRQQINLYRQAGMMQKERRFTEAEKYYRDVLIKGGEDPEIYWQLILCHYGIEYQKDDENKWIPTILNPDLDIIPSELSDWKRLLELAKDEGPEIEKHYQECFRPVDQTLYEYREYKGKANYDVFISVKQTEFNNETGRKNYTDDNRIGLELYDYLTSLGLKVFNSEKTKPTGKWEPYILSALISARVMIVVGTCKEYMESQWVKNEWSRFQWLQKNEKNRGEKGRFILCYLANGMKPQDIPKALNGWQAITDSRGANQELDQMMQEYFPGKSIIQARVETQIPEVQPITTSTDPKAQIPALLENARYSLEYEEFQKAIEFLDKVTLIDPKCSTAYAYKVCAKFGLRNEADLAETTFLYEDNTDWQKAVRFADPAQKGKYENYLEAVKKRVKKQIRDYAYDCAVELAVMPDAKCSNLESELAEYKYTCTHSASIKDNKGGRTGNRRRNGAENEKLLQTAVQNKDPKVVSEKNLKSAASMFSEIGDDEAKERAAQCLELAEQAKQKAIYQEAITLQNQRQNNIDSFEKAASMFQAIPDYKDARERSLQCKESADKIREALYQKALISFNKAGDESQDWKEVKNQLDISELDGYKDILKLREKANRQYEECVREEEEALHEELDRLRKEAETKKKNIAKKEQDYQNLSQQIKKGQSKGKLLPFVGLVCMGGGILWLAYMVFIIIELLTHGNSVQELNTPDQIRSGNFLIAVFTICSISLIIIGRICLNQRKKINKLEEERKELASEIDRMKSELQSYELIKNL